MDFWVFWHLSVCFPWFLSPYDEDLSCQESAGDCFFSDHFCRHETEVNHIAKHAPGIYLGVVSKTSPSATVIFSVSSFHRTDLHCKLSWNHSFHQSWQDKAASWGAWCQHIKQKTIDLLFCTVDHKSPTVWNTSPYFESNRIVKILRIRAALLPFMVFCRRIFQSTTECRSLDDK